MARTPSTMLPLGTPAPELGLPDLEGRIWTLADFQGRKALLVMFICSHCPFVKHINEGLGRLAADYAGKEAALVAVMPNDIENYPDDDLPHLRRQAAEHGFTFPYLVDSDQSVARAYRAACTPDFFLFGPDRRLAYRGQMDDSRPDSGIPVTGRDLRAALDAVLEGREVAGEQRPSLGCNIKWKAGREPDYFEPR